MRGDARRREDRVRRRRKSAVEEVAILTLGGDCVSIEPIYLTMIREDGQYRLGLLSLKWLRKRIDLAQQSS